MNVKHTARALALGALLALGSFSGSALADDQGPRWWEPQIKSMANKDGMVSKKDFMRMMEKKFDEMDKSKKGMISQQDLMRIFSDKTGA
jgi:hypothetical protein